MERRARNRRDDQSTAYSTVKFRNSKIYWFCRYFEKEKKVNPGVLCSSPTQLSTTRHEFAINSQVRFYTCFLFVSLGNYFVGCERWKLFVILNSLLCCVYHHRNCCHRFSTINLSRLQIPPFVALVLAVKKFTEVRELIAGLTSHIFLILVCLRFSCSILNHRRDLHG